MRLTRDEEEALLDLVEAMNPDQFKNLVFRATGVRTTDFVSAGATMQGASIDFIGWLQTNVHHAPAIVQEAIKRFPYHESTLSLRQAEARLSSLQAAQSALGRPDEAVLAAGVPVVDRLILRRYLAALRNGEDLPVVIVEGDRGLGRSHSWHLIRHVANALPNVVPLRIDLVGPAISEQTLPWVFNYLVRLLNLSAGEKPTTHGVTGGTLSARFISEFLTRVQSMRKPWRPTPWLVFDHLDRDIIVPEIKLFVMEIASQRLQGIFRGCVIFLLGPDPKFPLEDPAALARREPVLEFLDHEIVAAAERLNTVGHTPLADVELKLKLAALKALSNGRSGSELAGAVGHELVMLRQMVGAG
jgi:hypothetical protein